jgi:hypothetical protein
MGSSAATPQKCAAQLPHTLAVLRIPHTRLFCSTTVQPCMTMPVLHMSFADMAMHSWFCWPVLPLVVPLVHCVRHCRGTP